MAGFDYTKLPSEGFIDHKQRLISLVDIIKVNVKEWCKKGCRQYWNPDNNSCDGCPLDTLIHTIERDYNDTTG